jgi:hypothetical protein
MTVTSGKLGGASAATAQQYNPKVQTVRDQTSISSVSPVPYLSKSPF